MNKGINASLIIDTSFDEKDLQKGVYIAIVHATRIPPHIGLVIGGKYHSLTVKGQDINIPVEALIKNTMQRKIPALFVKIKAHATFSEAYLKEYFITNVQQFPRVDIGVATCLSPIKLFFSETYNLPLENVNFLFELVPLLYTEGLVESASTLFVDDKVFQLPVYTQTEINRGIAEVRNLVGSFARK